MRIAIHASPQIEWQQRYAKLATKGLARHNVETTITNSQRPVPCDVAIIMGPNMYQAIERSSVPFIMFNRKFLGNDPKVVHENVAISWDGFNGRGTFCVDEIDPNRLLKYFDPNKELLPWKRDGKYFLLCEQSNVGRATKYRTLNQYYTFVKTHSPYPVIFRHKPRSESAISYQKLKDDLEGAKAVVVLNSTISIDSLISGIPVISLDEGDPVYPITGHALAEITYSDRLPLFQYLAHCQWHYTEIENGTFWEHIYPKRGVKLCQWTNSTSQSVKQ